MYEKEVLRKLVTFVTARRPKWQFIQEDDIIRILTGQYVVDWKIIDEIIPKYNLTLADVTAHATGLVITIRIPDDVRPPTTS